MLEVGARLPALVLEGPGDRELALAELHADAPLAAVFLRHFG